MHCYLTHEWYMAHTSCRLYLLYCNVYGLLKTPLGFLIWFIYDSTSRHYNLFYNVLWPSDFASLSCSGSSALVLWSLWIWSSLICVGPSLDLLLLSACWSAFCDLLWPVFCVFCDLSSVFCLVCVFVYLLPLKRVLAPRKEDTMSWGFISLVSVAANSNNSVA
jgi:hypothetical protein